MRMNVEDRALRDPNIQRRLPRFTGLNRFDAIGRLLHVWGLCYDARSPVALIEDVDDRAELDGFARAMVSAGCARDLEDGTIWVCGVEERIGYLIEAADNGRRGGETRAAQVAAEGGRGKGGRFTKGPTKPPLVSDQGSSKGAPTPPVDADHTSSSGSGSAPDLSLSPEPPAPGEIGALVDRAVDALNVARAKLDPDSRRIGEHDDQQNREQLRQRLRATSADRRKPDLDLALTVLIAEAKLKGDVALLRLGMLGGPAAWPRLLAGSAKAPTPPVRAGPRFPAPVVATAAAPSAETTRRRLDEQRERDRQAAEDAPAVGELLGELKRKLGIVDDKTGERT